jgi:hypothetical protein
MSNRHLQDDGLCDSLQREQWKKERLHLILLISQNYNNCTKLRIGHSTDRVFFLLRLLKTFEDILVLHFLLLWWCHRFSSFFKQTWNMSRDSFQVISNNCPEYPCDESRQVPYRHNPVHMIRYWNLLTFLFICVGFHSRIIIVDLLLQSLFNSC